ncbi:type I-E CRISPR-associated protein Cse2/CasB [Micromonospora echinofusca]|uniref:Type I-E CRISPR-associated protein Cse2/CasB n=1 Tax=Micromonospora echinofusca TaxID=47858 RepID=A0ABS3VWD9_MICEH|nr:type I-E CRISPR-associated protein Cse2/CasB [Micromonospora echinofusca]MBO4208857.1 type I-E CRISPR-associated protein Cse2/CasB [Micromonospora echinofusca]
MTVTDIDPPAGPSRRTWARRRSELGDHVARTIGTLQARVLSTVPHPEAVSALARLRRGIGRTPGFDFTLERYLQVPEHLLGHRPADDAEAADTEHAVHDAVTLYALHQQSRRERMHVDRRGLGQALSDLVRRSTGPDGVRRRFAALGTASTYPESIHHLRSLITMLREHQIPLDYGLLADDLLTLRRPFGRPKVQAIWGREFFRSQPGTDTHTPDTTTAEEEPS